MGERGRNFDYARELVWMVGVVGVFSATMYVMQTYVSPYLSNLVDPDREKHERARLQAKAHLDRIKKGKPNEGSSSYKSEDDGPKADQLKLNDYENLIAMEMVSPTDISVGFADIAGLEDIIDELKESVIYPLTMPHIYSHAAALLSAPSGVLLYGPPGCGKTMMAKALARESGASFINLHISTITEKWYGDSNKLVRAVFSLARKVEPAIIFIDEIDAVLGTRRSGEHEASGMVKAEFMTLWDGLTSSNAAGTPARIVVLGATNRINDIDEAILRRMPKKFPVQLPGKAQRQSLLELILKDTRQDAESFDLDYVAKVTAGLSGSDLKELCRDAAMAPVREFMQQHRARGGLPQEIDPQKFRGIRTADFFGKRGSSMSKSNHDVDGPDFHQKVLAAQQITKANETEWESA